MAALMGALLLGLAMFFAEMGLGTLQISIVFGLFVSSRVFASLSLWLVMGSLVFSYVLMILAAYLFVRWMRYGRVAHFALLLGCAVVAVFTREEAYTLPVVLPIIWVLSSPSRKHWNRLAWSVLGLLVVVFFHIWLRHIVIGKAPSPQLTLSSLKTLFATIKASWLPGGYTAIGLNDANIQSLWIGFLSGLILLFVFLSRPRVLWLFVGICCIGTGSALFALAVARSFGIAMPTVAFMTAISIAIREVYHQIRCVRPGAKWRRHALVLTVALGLAVGIAGGFRRSLYVAESLHENCA